jgi:heme-degrading monooxygenase HmoA
MIKLIEMDENATLSAQMEENVGPVILINKFNVKPEDVDQLLKAWTADASYFKQRPGFISTQLHRGIAGICVFIKYAVWKSTQHFKEAFNRPDFKSKLREHPDSTTTSQHLFKKIAIPGICFDQ